MGWKKLNTDSSVKQSPVSLAMGGLIRDDAGFWSIGFHGKIGLSIVMF